MSASTQKVESLSVAVWQMLGTAEWRHCDAVAAQRQPDLERLVSGTVAQVVRAHA
jgi:hypothetical protein